MSMDKIREEQDRLRTKTIKVRTRCPRCQKNTVLEVSRAGYELWRGGLFIQRAFPDLTPDQRELLLTGYDAKCWDLDYAEDD